MSCDHELANEWARCRGKNASYITMFSSFARPLVYGVVVAVLVVDAKPPDCFQRNGDFFVIIAFSAHP